MFLQNAHPDYRKPIEGADADTFSEGAARDAEYHFATEYAESLPTPVVTLPILAKELGLGAVYVKDESRRLGLGSFKALGGAYAVARLYAEALHADPTSTDLTFVTASAGNHGLSVASGAQRLGASARIYIHSGVGSERAAAIARFGAKVIVVDGTFDDAVAEATQAAISHGWTLVSDTAWPGYERIPALVMQGYVLVAREALRQLPEPPTHIFAQAGVGGFAASLAAHFSLVLEEKFPRYVVVEPDRAACFVASMREGQPTRVSPARRTVMTMLECYQPSLVAWRVLSRLANSFMTVDEDLAVAVAQRLKGWGVNTSASGASGLAGLVRAASDRHIRECLSLNRATRVLLVNTEGSAAPLLQLP